MKKLDRRYKPVKEITDQERISMVKEIFSTITGRYDFLNRLLSLRRDVAWRRFAVKKMRFPHTARFLDIACGTGDLSLGAARRHRSIEIVGIDFVAEMLHIGKTKIASKNMGQRITLFQGDALALPFCSDSFDVTAMAFGIRNIPDRLTALKEMTRVVVPGGQVLILEMAFTRNWFSNILYHTYLNRILPLIGKVFSLNPSAYSYLADSIMNFPSREEFLQLMTDVGLSNVRAYSLTFGATYLYEGIK